MISNIVLERIVKKLEGEACPTHCQSVTFLITNGVITVAGCCCNDFYAHISARVRQELERESYIF